MNIQITPNSTAFFAQIKKQAQAIQSQISLLDKRRQSRLKVFHNCMNQYRKYVTKENQLLERNQKHCQPRNNWFREEVNKSWKIAIADRNIVLRSIARTNVLKKDIDEWLGRIQESAIYQNQGNHSMSQRQEMQDSKLMDKYNQILRQYGHKL